MFKKIYRLKVKPLIVVKICIILYSNTLWMNESTGSITKAMFFNFSLNVTNFYGLTGLPFKRLTSFILRPKKISQLKTEITQIERFLKILSCPQMEKSMAYWIELVCTHWVSQKYTSYMSSRVWWLIIVRHLIHHTA